MNGLVVNVEQLRDYLDHSGWVLHAKPNEYLEVWRAAMPNGEQEILLPTEVAVDKQRLLALATAKLSELLNLKELELLEKIVEYVNNVVAIRVVHEDVKGGSIPLEDGITLNKNAKELLVAAANAALERKPLYQGRPPMPVAKLLQSARLGQTAHGSYVVRVFCPDLDIEGGPDSFAQATTMMLESALSGLRSSIESYRESKNPIVFEEAVINGVSANLCDAIAKISGKNQQRAVHISLPSRQSGKLVPTEIRDFEFLPEHQEVIREASEYFRKTYTLHNQIVIGVIERLDRRVEQDDGSIRIATTLSNGIQRSVSLQLTAEEYQEAIRAHDSKMMVRVVGDVVVTPKTANVINGRDFRVVGNLSLFDT